MIRPHRAIRVKKFGELPSSNLGDYKAVAAKGRIDKNLHIPPQLFWTIFTKFSGLVDVWMRIINMTFLFCDRSRYGAYLSWVPVNFGYGTPSFICCTCAFHDELE